MKKYYNIESGGYFGSDSSEEQPQKKPDYNSAWYEKNQVGRQQYKSDLKKWQSENQSQEQPSFGHCNHVEIEDTGVGYYKCLFCGEHIRHDLWHKNQSQMKKEDEIELEKKAEEYGKDCDGDSIKIAYKDGYKAKEQELSQMPSTEDIKRWFQLLVGKGEDAMREDMKSWLKPLNAQHTIPEQLIAYIHKIDGLNGQIRLMGERIAELEAKEQQGNEAVGGEDEIYESVVRLVEKDNIQCELYSDTVKKLMDNFEIKRKI